MTHNITYWNANDAIVCRVCDGVVVSRNSLESSSPYSSDWEIVPMAKITVHTRICQARK